MLAAADAFPMNPSIRAIVHPTDFSDLSAAASRTLAYRPGDQEQIASRSRFAI
jgi:hypothetical protein